MDGGGRLTRSLRSLRPEADLKMAALGALILLRERIAERKKARAARLLKREQNSNRLIGSLERYIPRRLGIALTVLVLLGSAGFGVVKGDHLDDLLTALSDSRSSAANAAGFR